MSPAAGYNNALMRLILLACLLLPGAAAFAQEGEAAKILERVRSFTPTVKDLGWYQLNWVPNLKEAREKAAREKRPICLLVCINVFGNLYTGHC